MTSALRLTLMLCLNATSQAQSAPPAAIARPEFEVATIKPTDPKTTYNARFTYPGGRVVVVAYPLAVLVEEAFDLQYFQLTGGPDWINRLRWDVNAIPPANSASSHANPSSPRMPLNSEQRLMLQALLIDRFGLKYHFEDRDGPVYILSRGTRPLAMTLTTDPGAVPFASFNLQQGGIADGETTGTNISMTTFAVRISRYLERPVLDQTGLAGAYDFHLPAVDATNTDLINAIIDSVSRLGLKLRGAHSPVRTIVIDAATQPTSN